MSSRWYNKTDADLQREIERTVLPRVAEGLHQPRSSDCSTACLCHNVDNKRIAELVNRFSDDTPWTYAVYVLECRSRRVGQRVIREELKTQQRAVWADRAQSHDRLLYVGVSRSVVDRLKQHVVASGDGANFTQFFPAMRLLSVSWYRYKSTAYRAEPITADVLRNATPDSIYVSQPG